MAKIQHFTVGSVWRPQATFTIGSSASDPTFLTVLQQDPAGVETTISAATTVSALTTASTPVARLSTGVFQLSPGVTLTGSGYWFMKFAGTGAAQASIQEEIIVDPDEFTSNAGLSDRALVSLAETKDWLQQQNIDVGEDLELVRTINDASDRIIQESGRELKPISTGASTRTFDVYDYGYCVQVGDLAVLTTASNPVSIIASDWTTVISSISATNITTYPMVRQPWEPVRKIQLNPMVSPMLAPGMRVTVNATWGFPSVPGNIRQAALDAIAYVLDRDVEHWREDLAPVAGGGVTLTLSLPPSALEVANAYSEPFVG